MRARRTATTRIRMACYPRKYMYAAMIATITTTDVMTSSADQLARDSRFCSSVTVPNVSPWICAAAAGPSGS